MSDLRVDIEKRKEELKSELYRNFAKLPLTSSSAEPGTHGLLTKTAAVLEVESRLDALVDFVLGRLASIEVALADATGQRAL